MISLTCAPMHLSQLSLWTVSVSKMCSFLIQLEILDLYFGKNYVHGIKKQDCFAIQSLFLYFLFVLMFYNAGYYLYRRISFLYSVNFHRAEIKGKIYAKNENIKIYTATYCRVFWILDSLPKESYVEFYCIISKIRFLPCSNSLRFFFISGWAHRTSTTIVVTYSPACKKWTYMKTTFL